MDIIDIIKDEIKIQDLAKDLGYTPIPKGSKYYSLKEHDSLMINTEKNSYKRYATGEYGSVIDFYMNFTGKDIKDSIQDLKDILNHNGINVSAYENVKKDLQKSKTPLKEKKQLNLPEADLNNKNVFAYLIKSRKLDQDIVINFVKNKMLYQDKNKNCVFVSPSIDEPKFANVRGTNTKKSFRGDLSGCDYSHSFFIDNKKNNLILCESVIDMMSRMSFEKMGANITEGDYLAISGIYKAEEALNYHLKNKEYKKVSISFDMDDKGIEASEKVYSLLKENYPELDVKIERIKAKDWNELLVNYKEKEAAINKQKEMKINKEKNSETEI